MGNLDSFESMRSQCFKYSEGLVYFVDSSSQQCIEDVRGDLHDILSLSNLKNIPVLIMCNKQDIPQALTSGELREKLAIDQLKQGNVRMQECSAVKGTGLTEGLEWLSSIVNRKD
mmetsp:Transcript_12337/g.18492  ORF Transcript_12337/g.18492 Transcript_12337/m.18492 type:complete len:115 (-) Transcript_12337:162-506(-)